MRSRWTWSSLFLYSSVCFWRDTLLGLVFGAIMLIWYPRYYVFCMDALGRSETRDNVLFTHMK